MKLNFESIHYHWGRSRELAEYAEWLSQADSHNPGRIDYHKPPVGYEGWHTADVIGSEFVWMNNTFPKERFTWYHWFESVFIVPDEMLPLLILKWT